METNFDVHLFKQSQKIADEIRSRLRTKRPLGPDVQL